MSAPQTNNDNYRDGIAAITDSIVTNLNLSQDYLYADDGIGEQAMDSPHANPAGEAIGGVTQSTGFFTGTLNVQLITKDDPLPRPGHILSFRSTYYVVNGNLGPKRTKNKVVTAAFPVRQVVNPIITDLLSSSGQLKTESATASGYSRTAPTVVNARSGATKAFSLSAWTEEYPAAVVPSGLTINSSTGALTGSGVSAGTYYLKIKVTDTLANKPTLTGVGFLILTLS